MSSARDDLLASVRRALGRGPLDAAKMAELEGRLTTHPRNPVPKRSLLPHSEQVDLFAEMAERAAATVVRVARLAEVPGAVADFLAAQNLPATVRLAPDPALQSLPWPARPLLKVETGIAQPGDRASVAPAFAGIAETGTLMLVSGPTSPTTLNFLPENHIVVLRAEQVVGPFEDAWDRLRAARSDGDFPRAVNLITGPSRSADIEQRLVMGAHGPRRLHILLVAEGGDAQSEG